MPYAIFFAIGVSIKLYKAIFELIINEPV